MAQLGRYFVAIFVGVMALLAVLAVMSRPMDGHPFVSGNRLLVIAHQGGEKLRPDNTMPAFQHAVDLGADVLEMDIHSTRDDILVVMHDERVDRTTNGSGLIKEMLYTQIETLDAAYRWPHDDPVGPRPYRGQGILVPTLRDIFEAFPQMPMNIEIKQIDPPIVEPLCSLLREYNRTENVLIASFHGGTIKAFREICPGVATAGSESEIRAFFLLNTIGLGKVFQPAAEVFQVPEYSGVFHVLTERFIAGARRHNVEVHVWTVDEPEEMQRMIDLDVDGIITNRPDLLLEMLGRASPSATP